MWRSIGFLMSFAVVLEGMAIIAFLTILVGGKQRREQGWGILATLIVIPAVMQAVAMSLVVRLFEVVVLRNQRQSLIDRTCRHIFTRTMNASSSAGGSTTRGFFAQPAGLSRYFAPSQSPPRLSSCLRKAATSLFPILLTAKQQDALVMNVGSRHYLMKRCNIRLRMRDERWELMQLTNDELGGLMFGGLSSWIGSYSQWQNSSGSLEARAFGIR